MERAGRNAVAGVLLDPAVNLGGPVLAYALLRGRCGETGALLASALPPLAWGLFGVWRRRRMDALSVLALCGVALSLLMLAGGGGPRWLLLREKLATLLVGLGFLGSAAIGRPLVGVLARAGEARRGADALAAFDRRRTMPAVRRTLRVMTLVWGFGLVAEAVSSAAAAWWLPVGGAVAAGPALGWAAFGTLGAWTAWYRRRAERAGDGGSGMDDREAAGPAAPAPA